LLKKNSQNKIAITGSEGLIGKSIYDLLYSLDYKLIKIDKLNKIDVSKKKVITDFLNYHKPVAIIHCAAHPGGLSNKFPILDIKINCLGSMNIINWCKKNQSKLIFTSSSAVYGDTCSRKINENSKLKPGTIYAANKIAIENYIKIFSKLKNFPWTILRFFPTYGAEHKPNTYQGIVNVMLTQINNSKTIIVKGSLKRERDLVYCKDSSQAIYKTLISENVSQKIINIGTGKKTTVYEIIKTIIDINGYSINNYDIIVEKKLPGDPFSSICDISLAKKKLNFSPKYSFVSGLKDMLK
jgi:UDP-glucose 4-epimerase